MKIVVVRGSRCYGWTQRKKLVRIPSRRGTGMIHKPISGSNNWRYWILVDVGARILLVHTYILYIHTCNKHMTAYMHTYMHIIHTYHTYMHQIYARTKIDRNPISPMFRPRNRLMYYPRTSPQGNSD